jgi:hypothetical protein
VTAIIDPKRVPSHLFNIRELDFSDDLFAERIAGPWVRLAARTVESRREAPHVQDEVFRQSLLIAPEAFATVFDKLESVGNVLGNLGKPVASVRGWGATNEYNYAAFHSFEFPFVPVIGEPLVFLHSDTSTAHFFINPDLWMFLELEEKAPERGIWWDPRRGVDALIRRVTENGNLETVEIRPAYLFQYLQARQMSLIVGRYRQKLLFDPPQTAIDAFANEDLTLGSAENGAKAILQNRGLGHGTSRLHPYLQRRLHLWFEIQAPAIDLVDPWYERPSFDPFTFTLPTSEGAVAPARWKHPPNAEGRSFEGIVCDFMDRVYFRQEVLTKYEGSSGFDVKDDGSVSCYYWGLARSTSRIGNELLSTAIGDFAEGVPFEEWPHWRQYVVDPPSQETLRALEQEPAIPEAVNSVATALAGLNAAIDNMAAAIGVSIADAPWRGSLDSLAGRQLKWVYPATVSDGEFLKRAALASTLFLDGLQTAPLRSLLAAIGKNLHQTFEKSPQSLSSRNLLQRTALVAHVIEDFQPDLQEIPKLIQHAEGKATETAQPDLQAELEESYRRIRDEFAPLAFLYDLRTHGGLAHPPNPQEAAAAAAKLGLPQGNWHRTDYLSVLTLVAESIHRTAARLDAAADVARSVMESQE